MPLAKSVRIWSIWIASRQRENLIPIGSEDDACLEFFSYQWSPCYIRRFDRCSPAELMPLADYWVNNCIGKRRRNRRGNPRFAIDNYLECPQSFRWESPPNTQLSGGQTARIPTHSGLQSVFKLLIINDQNNYSVWSKIITNSQPLLSVIITILYKRVENISVMKSTFLCYAY